MDEKDTILGVGQRSELTGKDYGSAFTAQKNVSMKASHRQGLFLSPREPVHLPVGGGQIPGLGQDSTTPMPVRHCTQPSHFLQSQWFLALVAQEFSPMPQVAFSS